MILARNIETALQQSTLVDMSSSNAQTWNMFTVSKSNKTTVKTWPAGRPWYRIHADYLRPLYGKIIVIVVDSFSRLIYTTCFSKWPQVFQMANIGSK